MSKINSFFYVKVIKFSIIYFLIFLNFLFLINVYAQGYKLCPNCKNKILKLEEFNFDINFCPACGTDLKNVNITFKTNSEKILDLIKQKQKQVGDIKQLKATEWIEKAETSEDKITKIACFLNAIELDKNIPEVYNNLGVLYTEKLLLDEAISCFKKAIELKPNYSIALNNLAKCLVDNNKCDEAIKYYQKAIELEPNNAIFYCNLADVYLKLKQYDQSINYYKKAIELDKDKKILNLAKFKLSIIELKLKNKGE